MKIILVNSPYLDMYGPIKISAGRYFPLGIGYLAAVLKKQGYEVLFLDPEVQGLDAEDIGRLFAKEKPDIVGISCASPNFRQAVKIAALAKKNSLAKIVLGGIHASSVPKWILENNMEIDIVVIGEGENTLLELCNYIVDHRTIDYGKIKGIAYRECSNVIINPCRAFIEDLDSLPFPARELIDLRLYRPHPYVNRAKKSCTILTSRGCPNFCVFCASHLTLGYKFRQHSAEYVLDEMGYLHNELGVNHLVINDDTFTIDKQRVEKICNGIIKNKFKIDWYCFMRVNNVTKDLIRLMRRAGCSSIGFGIESGDAQVLERLKKGINMEQCRTALKICNTEKIKALAFFVFGCPGDTTQTINKTISFAKELKPTLAFFNMLTPYPGTEIFEKFYADKIKNFGDLDNFVAVGPKASVDPIGFTRKQMQSYIFWANVRFYLHPLQLWRILIHIESWAELKVHLKAGLGLILQMKALIKKRGK